MLSVSLPSTVFDTQRWLLLARPLVVEFLHWEKSYSESNTNLDFWIRLEFKNYSGLQTQSTNTSFVIAPNAYFARLSVGPHLQENWRKDPYTTNLSFFTFNCFLHFGVSHWMQLRVLLPLLHD